MARRRRIYGRRRRRSALMSVSSRPAKFDLDSVQAMLTLGGNVGGVGIFADIANTAISVGRTAVGAVKGATTGDWKDAKKNAKEIAWNALSVVPLTQAVTAPRTIKKGIELTQDVAGIVDNVNAAKSIHNMLASK